MTYEDFQKIYCDFCGTQKCKGRPEDLMYHCKAYQGEIPDIPKIKTDWQDFLERVNNLNTDEILQMIKGE